MNNQTKTNNAHQFIILLIFTMVSFITSILLLTDANKPGYYSSIFLLPLIFSLVSLVFNKTYSLIPTNIGTSLIIALFFVRMVLSPLLLYFGGYPVIITNSTATNMTDSVLLICYESLCVFFILYIQAVNQKKSLTVIEKNEKIAKKINSKYTFFVLLIFGLIAVMYSVTPEFLSSYRTIFEINDEHFVNSEDAYAIFKYGTTFITKFTMVTGTYLMRVATVLFPAFIVVFLAQKKHTTINKILSFIVCFLPFLFIPGAIAMSLIYVLCLIFLRLYLYPSKYGNRRIAIVLIVGGCTVIAWWIFRASINNSNVMNYFSENFITYFSGANIVSGVFNLPKDIDYKITYFLYDYLDSIPYGSTVFNLSSPSIQSFFNDCNNTTGQIPSTIGMGYYYFGPILSPLYSMLFAYVSCVAAKKISVSSNPFARLRLLLTTIYFSLGIIMYNIEITFTTLFSLILPLYILERMAFKNEQHS